MYIRAAADGQSQATNGTGTPVFHSIPPTHISCCMIMTGSFPGVSNL